MYAKFISETEIKTEIPTTVRLDGAIFGNIQNNPEILTRLGYFEVVDGETEEFDPETQHLEPRYVQGNNQIIKNMVAVVNGPAKVKTYKKALIFRWLLANEIWGNFKMLLASNELLNEFWENCTEFDDDDPNWPAMLMAVKMGLYLADDQVADLLAFAEKTC